MKKKELKKYNKRLVKYMSTVGEEYRSLQRKKSHCIMHLVDYSRKVGAECMIPEDEVVRRCIQIVRESFE